MIAAATSRSPEEISPDTNLAELGLGSLDTITLLFEMEEVFDVTIPNEVIAEIQTVNDIVTKLEQFQSGQTLH